MAKNDNVVDIEEKISKFRKSADVYDYYRFNSHTVIIAKFNGIDL